MELVFDMDRSGNIIHARFEGLDGRECVTSVKQALSVLQVRNPTITFSDDAQNGLYDSMTDAEYNQRLHAVETLGRLWHYDGDDPEAGQANMNALMLLANALEMIIRQSVQQQDAAGGTALPTIS